MINMGSLTLLHSEQPILNRVLAILGAVGLRVVAWSLFSVRNKIKKKKKVGYFNPIYFFFTASQNPAIANSDIFNGFLLNAQQVRISTYKRG